MSNCSAVSVFPGASGQMPGPAFPALSGLIEPNPACFGVFLKPAGVSCGAASWQGMPTSQLVCLDLSGSIRRARMPLSQEEKRPCW